MSSVSVLEGLEACADHLQNMSDAEKQEFAEDFWSYVDAVSHAQTYLNEAHPSIVTCIDTFPSAIWYPAGVRPYIKVINDIGEYIYSERESSKLEEWPHRLNDWGRLNPSRYALYRPVEEVILRAFPELTPENMRRILTLYNDVQGGQIPETSFYEQAFTTLSKRPYVHIDSYDKEYDEIQTVYYPVDEYDYAFVVDTYLSEYRAACEQDRQGYEDWSNKQRGN